VNLRAAQQACSERCDFRLALHADLRHRADASDAVARSEFENRLFVHTTW
jgi:hypothetical protein